MSLPAQHKLVKLIALVEERPSDWPWDRIDREADAMQEAVDPQLMVEALARASASGSPRSQEESSTTGDGS